MGWENGNGGGEVCAVKVCVLVMLVDVDICD